VPEGGVRNEEEKREEEREEEREKETNNNMLFSNQGLVVCKEKYHY
jgi:hypothetical protein